MKTSSLVGVRIISGAGVTSSSMMGERTSSGVGL